MDIDDLIAQQDKARPKLKQKKEVRKQLTEAEVEQKIKMDKGKEANKAIKAKQDRYETVERKKFSRDLLEAKSPEEFSKIMGRIMVNDNFFFRDLPEKYPMSAKDARSELTPEEKKVLDRETHYFKMLGVPVKEKDDHFEDWLSSYKSVSKDKRPLDEALKSLKSPLEEIELEYEKPKMYMKSLDEMKQDGREARREARRKEKEERKTEEERKAEEDRKEKEDRKAEEDERIRLLLERGAKNMDLLEMKAEERRKQREDQGCVASGKPRMMVMPNEILIGGVCYVPKINEDKYPESGYGEDFIDTRLDDMSDPLKGNGKYALQTIIISKNVPLDRAEQSAKDISKKKKLMMREKDETRHFRVLPPNRFIKKTFRSKKINPDITLTFGELKPEYEKLVGHGFFDYFKKGYDYVKDTISGVKEKAIDTASNIKDTLVSAKDKAVEYLKPRLDDYNNRTKEMLKEYGQGKVTKAIIYRKPIDAYIPVVLNLVSLGKWNEAVKKVGYDKFFHLSLIVEVKGEMLNVEKLDVVSITKGVPQGKGVESFIVPLEGKNFTLLEMLETARQAVGDRAFFEYDSFENNCQSFVSYLLKGQGLYGEEEKGFTYQPIKSIVDEMPDYVKKFQRGLTDISATINKILGLGMSGGRRIKDSELADPNDPRITNRGMYEKPFDPYDKLKEQGEDILRFYGLSGGNQMAGFIRAMMASKSTDPEAIQKGKDKLARTNEARAKRGEPKLTLKQFNEARSIPKKIDVPVMSQSSYNVITKADEEGKEKKIKKFYEFISQKIQAGLKAVNGLYPIDELYAEFQGKKEVDRKKAHAEVEKAGRTKRRGKPPREKQTEEQKAEKRREAQRKYYAKKKGVAPEEKNF